MTPILCYELPHSISINLGQLLQLVSGTERYQQMRFQGHSSFKYQLVQESSRKPRRGSH
uniref:Ovule protein n=1 Tax=Ascaris lumbricoides TaxID=6252 RepID=A0A0M3IEJ5_ASCLU